MERVEHVDSFAEANVQWFSIYFCQEGNFNFSLPTAHLELSDLSFNNSNENISPSSIVEQLLPKYNVQ